MPLQHYLHTVSWRTKTGEAVTHLRAAPTAGRAALCGDMLPARAPVTYRILREIEVEDRCPRCFRADAIDPLTSPVYFP